MSLKNKRLHVSNIPYNMIEKELEDLFKNHGSVQSVKIVFDRDTQQSKGYGFVEMSTLEEAEKAVKNLNNYEYNSRTIRVQEAFPPKDRWRD